MFPFNFKQINPINFVNYYLALNFLYVDYIIINQMQINYILITNNQLKMKA